MSSEAAVVATAVSYRSCSETPVGAYCHEYHLKHVVHGKIFRTLWLLISRAGFLTQEF